MLNCGRRGLALLLTASFALQPTIGLADTGAGSATAVQNHVEGVVNGQTQTLSSGSAIYSDELVRTAHNGVAELQFIDSTRLSVGPTSEVRLDKFVYDPQKGAGALVLQATRGSYRFVTGVQDHQSYSIKTPYATLGVRGTVVEGNLEGVRNQVYYKAPRRDAADTVCKDGYEKIKLVEGAVIVTTNSGKTITVTEPNTVVTVCSNGNFSTQQVAESILNFTPLNYAALPGAALAAALAAAAAAAVVLSHQEDNVSPN